MLRNYQFRYISLDIYCHLAASNLGYTIPPLKAVIELKKKRMVTSVRNKKRCENFAAEKTDETRKWTSKRRQNLELSATKGVLENLKWRNSKNMALYHYIKSIRKSEL